MLHILKAVEELVHQFKTDHDFYGDNEPFTHTPMPDLIGADRDDWFLIGVLDVVDKGNEKIPRLMIGYLMNDSGKVHAVMGSCYLGTFPSVELAAKGVVLAFRG